jgi:hypothetical protein
MGHMTPREQLIQEVLLAPDGIVETLLKIMATLKQGIRSFRVETGVVAVGKIDRPIGLCRGEFEVPSDFDAPLPDDVLSLFE